MQLSTMQLSYRDADLVQLACRWAQSSPEAAQYPYLAEAIREIGKRAYTEWLTYCHGTRSQRECADAIAEAMEYEGPTFDLNVWPSY